ncbi:MAG: DUF2235 domain-containing protein [Cytophagales bacterium]|nr:DUF2235 domain-containing protein [Cytophagales bacterium]
MAKIEKEYQIDFDQQPKARNVIILLDGTWQDENEGDKISNVVKLWECLEKDSDRQITRYFRGIGNDEEFSLLGSLISGFTGHKEKKVRQHAYSTINKEFRPGDRIFIFGFSRGAACARMLANDLYSNGLYEKIRITSVPKSNKRSNHVEVRFKKYKVEGRKLDIDVEFLGVWDTVGAFGIPMKIFGIPFNKWNLFKDMHIAQNIKKALHIVAIDETRDPFKPTLMNKKPDIVKEVWFPGVHSDIGGSYVEDRLAKISLNFMIKEFKKAVQSLGGPEILFDDEKVKKHTSDTYDKAVFHFHGLGWKKSIRDIFVQFEDNPTNEKPNIHRSVFDLQKSNNVHCINTKKKIPAKYLIQYNPINVKALNGNYTILD